MLLTDLTYGVAYRQPNTSQIACSLFKVVGHRSIDNIKGCLNPVTGSDATISCRGFGLHKIPAFGSRARIPGRESFLVRKDVLFSSWERSVPCVENHFPSENLDDTEP